MTRTDQARQLAKQLYRGGMTRHHLDLIEAALADVERSTRERCAQVAESFNQPELEAHEQVIVERVAAAIRQELHTSLIAGASRL